MKKNILKFTMLALFFINFNIQSAASIAVDDEAQKSAATEKLIDLSQVEKDLDLCNRVINRKDVKEIKKLIDAGANVNTIDRNGQPVLFLAIQSLSGGHCIEMVKLLLENNANVNITDKFKETSLFKAAASGSNVLVQLLLNFRADFNLSNNKGQKAINIATSKLLDFESGVCFSGTRSSGSQNRVSGHKFREIVRLIEAEPSRRIAQAGARRKEILALLIASPISAVLIELIASYLPSIFDEYQGSSVT